MKHFKIPDESFSRTNTTKKFTNDLSARVQIASIVSIELGAIQQKLGSIIMLSCLHQSLQSTASYYSATNYVVVVD
ncbi:hypothetical protein E2C01_012005 [Portunus trituberculatus]|uniref:Uncharacterized protein n=1 Tax=Portunus trituberculatus TaxID=210409 RepID=A0A5B7DD03_PORTR|nr:hypothetical protein [Portunus trituberculatus]